MIINEKLIDLSVKENTRDEVIEVLAKKAEAEGRISDIKDYIQAVLHRENEFSTAVGFGVAIPHGKSKSVTEPFLAFARVNDIDWKSMDGNPVDLVFLIGVPESEAGSLHLKILAAISRKLMKEDFRAGLRKASTPSELLEFLKENELGI